MFVSRGTKRSGVNSPFELIKQAFDSRRENQAVNEAMFVNRNTKRYDHIQYISEPQS